MVIELIKRNGPINATPLTSKLLLIVAPTRGKKPYKPGREKTAYKIAEKNQFSEALKISKPSDKIIPSFNDSESSNSDKLLTSDNEDQEDDLEIPAFLRRQKN